MELGMIGLGPMKTNLVRAIKSVPAPVISSCGEAAFTEKLPSAMRYRFGGYAEKTTTLKGDAS